MSETQQMPLAPAEGCDRCEQCQAPVDRVQRYCVNCGAHRRHVPDPAARYMSQVSAHTRRGVARSAGASRLAGAPRGSVGLLGALGIALIPVAAAVGVSIGRSSNNGDAGLLRAIESQRPQTTTIASVGSSAAPPASTGASVPSAAGRPARTGHRHARARPAAASASSATANGKVTRIVGSKVTAAEQAAGSSEAAKVQNSTGANYVQAGNNLPSSVVVGP